MQLAQANYGKSHISTAEYSGVLAKALCHVGRLDEAETILNETVKIREAAPDSCQLDLADNLITLAELYLATNRPGEADAAAERAAAMIEDKLLPTSLTFAALHAVLAQTSARRGEHTEAINHLRQAEQIRRQVQTPSHPRFAGLYTAGANVYAAAGDDATADRYRRQAAEIRASANVGSPYREDKA